jgi:hypothetical protein
LGTKQLHDDFEDPVMRSRNGSSTRIPISLGFGRVWKFEGLEFNGWVSGRMDGLQQYTKVTDVTPMYTARFGFTLLFPDFEL